MKGIEQVTADKLRGGYYTADAVVELCIRRVRALLQGGAAPRTWLEPSAGDGAFLRGLTLARDAGSIPAPLVTAVERNADEAAKCAALLEQGRLEGTLANACFFEWSGANSERFDAVVGNPPFVRYQFVEARQRALFERQMRELGIELGGVSNLWIPFALASLSHLRSGGAFALVLPGELVSTLSAGAFRHFLLRDFAALQVDLVPRDTFAELLQDVVVVSGRRTGRAAPARRLRFCEHRRGAASRWVHSAPASALSWMRYLLTEEEVAAFQAARALPGVLSLGEVARLEVSIVTGANAFFTVDEATKREHELEPWARPLLARTADCAGVVFTEEDHRAARARGRRAWLLDFSATRPTPTNGAAAYLARGAALGLPLRYKCRIREPWYRVPYVEAGRLLLTKRAHLHHRLLLNEQGAFTTDTIYRGAMHARFAARARDLVAGFQNTLTLLSTELEGRTYGGGVLELVPSEIARLSVPLAPLQDSLLSLDATSRQAGGQKDGAERVRTAVDERLRRELPGYGDLLPILERARARLLERRHRSQVEPTPAAR